MVLEVNFGEIEKNEKSKNKKKKKSKFLPGVSERHKMKSAGLSYQGCRNNWRVLTKFEKKSQGEMKNRSELLAQQSDKY